MGFFLQHISNIFKSLQVLATLQVYFPSLFEIFAHVFAFLGLPARSESCIWHVWKSTYSVWGHPSSVLPLRLSDLIRFKLYSIVNKQVGQLPCTDFNGLRNWKLGLMFHGGLISLIDFMSQHMTCYDVTLSIREDLLSHSKTKTLFEPTYLSWHRHDSLAPLAQRKTATLAVLNSPKSTLSTLLRSSTMYE